MAKNTAKPTVTSAAGRSAADRSTARTAQLPSAKAAVLKRARPQRAAMSKGADLTRAEVSILQRMAGLEPDTPRYRVLDAALAFKASWVILGEHLADVQRTGLWRGWGYASFERYCTDEVQITGGTAKKLVRSFQWLGAEAPEYLPPHGDDNRIQVSKRDAPSGKLPDLSAVTVLADAKKHFDEARVPEDAYLALKQAALDGEGAASLRRTLKESIPAHLRPKQALDKVRHLRRALTACVKVLDELREWDTLEGDPDTTRDELLVRAEDLRDAIALRLPRSDDDGEATPDAGAPARAGDADTPADGAPGDVSDDVSDDGEPSPGVPW